jgi:hypothetical protein
MNFLKVYNDRSLIHRDEQDIQVAYLPFLLVILFILNIPVHNI